MNRSNGRFETALVPNRSPVSAAHAGPAAQTWLGIALARTGLEREACDVFRLVAESGERAVAVVGQVFGAAPRQDSQALHRALANGSFPETLGPGQGVLLVPGRQLRPDR